MSAQPASSVISLSSKKQVTDKPRYFGAIPMRALCDDRVERSHLRVLGAISYFDRFAKNGSGCYATLEKLSELTNTHTSTISRCRSDLCDWGYLYKRKQAKTKRPQYVVNHDHDPPGKESEAANLLHGANLIRGNLLHGANKEISLRE